MTTESTRTIADSASALTEPVAAKAANAIRSTQAVAHDAIDRLADKVDGARERVAPALNRLSSQAEAAARRSAAAVRETSAQIRERAAHASETTVGYIKEEPVKAMLIAAATGAALMALVSLVSLSRNRD